MNVIRAIGKREHIHCIFGTIGRRKHIHYISIDKQNVLFSINWKLYTKYTAYFIIGNFIVVSLLHPNIEFV